MLRAAALTSSKAHASMDLGLKDRITFVAGASSGLGEAAATELAREGARVAICSRSQARIREAARRIRDAADLQEDRQEDPRVLPLVCDVRDEEAIERAVRQTSEHFGGLHVLVTNAGGPPPGAVDDFDAEAWRDALELNLLSTINLCRHALPLLRRAAKEDGLARIIMITSVSAKQPIPGLYLSNVARAGVQGFAKSLSEEVGADGITVNTILPGYTRTERLEGLIASRQERTDQTAEEVEAAWAEGTALKRIGEPGEFAAALTFLASARASYITGVALPVDGGQVKHLL